MPNELPADAWLPVHIPNVPSPFLTLTADNLTDATERNVLLDCPRQAQVNSSSIV